MTMNNTENFVATALIHFAAELFLAAGCNREKADTIAEVLVEADLMGHTTHGLALAAGYLDEIQKGHLQVEGEPDVLVDRPTLAVWDGHYLPGIWLTRRGLAQTAERARTHGLAALTIRRSHHIACLMSYLEEITSQGLMVILTCSDPASATVAPFGARTPVFSPDPLAVGIPTAGEPILIDMSASITTNGLSARLRKEGRKLPGAWAIDAVGEPSDDPAVLFSDPTGCLLPTGGLDHGHKGYGLALLVEALTQGLSGFGRMRTPDQWGASVYMQVMDPALFAGFDDFKKEMEWMAESCRTSEPLLVGQQVRLPGQASLARKRQALAQGVVLYPGVLDGLLLWAEKYQVAPPS